MEKVGETFQKAYFSILHKRKGVSFSKKHKHFQKYRRGRYAEFNLVYDRGTLRAAIRWQDRINLDVHASGSHLEL